MEKEAFQSRAILQSTVQRYLATTRKQAGAVL